MLGEQSHLPAPRDVGQTHWLANVEQTRLNDCLHSDVAVHDWVYNFSMAFINYNVSYDCLSKKEKQSNLPQVDEAATQ